MLIISLHYQNSTPKIGIAIKNSLVTPNKKPAAIPLIKHWSNFCSDFSQVYQYPFKYTSCILKHTPHPWYKVNQTNLSFRQQFFKKNMMKKRKNSFSSFSWIFFNMLFIFSVTLIIRKFYYLWNFLLNILPFPFIKIVHLF